MVVGNFTDGDENGEEILRRGDIGKGVGGKEADVERYGGGGKEGMQIGRK